MDRPPESAMMAALDAAKQSRCAKSRRGAAVFKRTTAEILGAGYNGPPGTVACDGTQACRESCRYRCEHAEARALMWMMASMFRNGGVMVCSPSDLDLVHVKIDANAELVAGGGPSCMPCAVSILDVDLGFVWLYENVVELSAEIAAKWPEPKAGFAWHVSKHGAELTARMRYIDGVAKFRIAPVGTTACWLRYRAAEFHELTRLHCGLH